MAKVGVFNVIFRKNEHGDLLFYKLFYFNKRFPAIYVNKYNIPGMHHLIKTATLIPSFGLRDNSVHFHEYSPFWVGIFIILKKKTAMFTVWCRLANQWIISIIMIWEILQYVNMDIHYCPWHLRKTHLQALYYTYTTNTYQQRN